MDPTITARVQSGLQPWPLISTLSAPTPTSHYVPPPLSAQAAGLRPKAVVQPQDASDPAPTGRYPEGGFLDRAATKAAGWLKDAFTADPAQPSIYGREIAAEPMAPASAPVQRPAAPQVAVAAPPAARRGLRHPAITPGMSTQGLQNILDQDLNPSPFTGDTAINPSQVSDNLFKNIDTQQVAPAGLRPRISEATQFEGKPLDAQAADLTGAPGDFNYSADGTNGGFGLTRNADGTVGKMFALRQRTAAEDAAHPQEFQPVAPQAPVDMSEGSQGAWDQEQKLNHLLNRPLGLRVAHLVNEQGNLAVNQQNANTNTANIGSTIHQRDTLLPVQVGEGVAGIRNTNARTGLVGAETNNAVLTGSQIVPNAAADRTLKAEQGYGIRTHASVALAELPSNIAAKNAVAAKDISFVQNNPTKQEISAEKNATTLQAIQDKQEAPINELALTAAPIAGTDIATAKTAIKAGLRAKKGGWFSKPGFYNASGERVDPATLGGSTGQPPVAPAGMVAKVGGKLLTSDGKGGWK